MAMQTRISKSSETSTKGQVFDSESQRVWKSSSKQIPRNYGQVFDNSQFWHLVPEEIGKGPYEMCYYLSLLKNGSVPDRSVRVHIVGNYAQGKTSLVKRLLKAETKRTTSTDGIDILKLRSADSFLQTREPENLSESTDERGTFSVEGMFDSGNTSINYDLWDFGGQYVFYATHALFHSNRAIYVLVMDLTKKFDTIVRDTSHPNETGNRNVEYFIKFWMNSIHSFAGSLDGFEPPVILVGTHIDQVQGLRTSQLKHAEIFFEDVRSLFDGTQILNHFHKKEFAVNNLNRHDIVIDELREEIMKIGRSKVRNVEIPTRWVYLDHKLKYVTQKVITIANIQTLILEYDLQTMPIEELKLFLQYQHAKGTPFLF
ncbi:probable serine/threonine-protein kinase roco5 [Ruditapes philippinarum]|uniref:probable serine/threonine-protein kinase roco5 n=1 Tax=Ruditapes philippinarum TaxID=129788 RepID=UPI00295BC564|nr:probable serine/threonine-protein kinase roco5 [Ruditapes philippinarum]